MSGSLPPGECPEGGGEDAALPAHPEGSEAAGGDRFPDGVMRDANHAGGLGDGQW